MTRLESPFDAGELSRLRIGDKVLLSGIVYTGRDAAHKRLVDMLDRNEPLPLDLRGAAIYFAGPCPAPPGMPIGSVGPTTSGRMDAYSPRLMDECGLMAMIGKGNRSPKVVESMKRNGAVYFAATGGAGALIAKCVVSCETVAFADLGPEAIYRLEVRDFPLVVAIDSTGGNLYERLK